jgi:hypothetical protein
MLRMVPLPRFAVAERRLKLHFVRLLHRETGGTSRRLAEGAGRKLDAGERSFAQYYHYALYFTAPATTPRVSVRWKIRKNITVGRMPSRPAAA